MTRLKIFNFAFIFLMLFVSGCTGTETTGEYIVDAEITTKIKTKFLKESQLKSREISVETYKREVQLSGFVTTYKEAKIAEKLARSVKGVSTVHNDIKIRNKK